MTTKRPTPSNAQWIALLDFRDRYGRTWKDALWTKWGNDQDHYEPHAADLHAIRNHADFGPSWLHTLKPDELQRQRERFTLTSRDGTDESADADVQHLAATFAAEDGQLWYAMTPSEREPYRKRAGVILISLNAARRERERGF